MCTALGREHDFEGFGGAKFDEKSMKKKVQKLMRKMSAKKGVWALERESAVGRLEHNIKDPAEQPAESKT